MRAVLTIMVVLIGLAAAGLVAVADAPAHQDGCHRWHSCPSDTGSYVCGDLGYYSECPTGPSGVGVAESTGATGAAGPAAGGSSVSAVTVDPHATVRRAAAAKHAAAQRRLRAARRALGAVRTRARGATRRAQDAARAAAEAARRAQAADAAVQQAKGAVVAARHAASQRVVASRDAQRAAQRQWRADRNGRLLLGALLLVAAVLVALAAARGRTAQRLRERGWSTSEYAALVACLGLAVSVFIVGGVADAAAASDSGAASAASAVALVAIGVLGWLSWRAAAAVDGAAVSARGRFARWYPAAAAGAFVVLGVAAAAWALGTARPLPAQADALAATAAAPADGGPMDVAALRGVAARARTHDDAAARAATSSAAAARRADRSLAGARDAVTAAQRSVRHWRGVAAHPETAGGSGSGAADGQSGTTSQDMLALVGPSQALGAGRTKDAGCTLRGALPDPACTPGAVFRHATKSRVCQVGYSTEVRRVSDSLKREVLAEYGVTDYNGERYEIDHLVPLELGGSNAIDNLFPEPAAPVPGFHEKDVVENATHRAVCEDDKGLGAMQRQIARDWTSLRDASSNAASG